VFELTPEALKRDDEISRSASIAPQTARRKDRRLLVLMALALGYFAIDKIVLTPSEVFAGAQRAQVWQRLAHHRAADLGRSWLAPVIAKL
jgi:hypothetical protein